MAIQRNKSDPWRRLYIRLLTEPHTEWSNEKEDFTKDQILELEAIADLVDSGYLRGSVIRDVEGDVVNSATNGVTLSGKLFAEAQQAILDGKSLWGRIQSGAGLFIGWLSGIASALIIWMLTK